LKPPAGRPGGEKIRRLARNGPWLATYPGVMTELLVDTVVEIEMTARPRD
jgi:hypothetical protein